MPEAMSNHTNGSLTSKPVIRLCHIVKWENYDGYGFNLHAEKNKPGQFIGKVDDGSPAEAAGLKEGDRIVEVNDSNVLIEDHKHVVGKIKQIENETRLLVVDKKSFEYFQENSITITNSLPEVITLKTPPQPSKPEINGNGEVHSTTTVSPSPKSERSLSSTSSNEEKKEIKNEISGNKLNLNMSVDEIRNKIASRKKFDPKKETIDIKKKHEIIDKL